MTDILGNYIEPGCLLAYPGRYSSTIWLNVLRVERIHLGPSDSEDRIEGTLVKDQGWRRRQKAFITRASIDRCVIVRDPDA